METYVLTHTHKANIHAYTYTHTHTFIHPVEPSVCQSDCVLE